MKDPHKAAEVLLANGSVGDAADDLLAFQILMVVADARYGKADPRVIVYELVKDYGRKAIAAMVKRTKAA